MELRELVDEARKKSDEFNEKFLYWSVKRRTIDQDWLFFKLIEILGADYVEQRCKEKIKSNKEE
jgi:hypothetical protein